MLNKYNNCLHHKINLNNSLKITIITPSLFKATNIAKLKRTLLLNLAKFKILNRLNKASSLSVNIPRW